MTSTTNFYAESGEGRTETDAAVAAGMAMVAPMPVPDEPGIFIANDGTIIDVRPTLEKYADYPARKVGRRTVTDVDSFVAYVQKHSLDGWTEMWANADRGTILAVLNTHGEDYDSPGWGDHTVQLALPFTKDWTEWKDGDGRYFDQAAFSEFIQDHITNFVEPAGATMLEMAESFRSTTRVDFDSSKKVKSGETQLVYKETQSATAGRTGELTIPDTFTLALQVHERGPAYRVAARLRYRIHDQRLTLGYRLDRPDDVVRAAFDAAATSVESGTGFAVWHGSPTA